MKQFFSSISGYLQELGEVIPFLQEGLRILLILLMAWVVLRVLRRMLRLFSTRLKARSTDPEEIKRIDTLTKAFRYIVQIVVWIMAVMLILSALGISIAPILATAGVAGIAVGFAAQSLVKDYFTGFIMLLENQIRLGDIVDIGGTGGVVEEVTLRYVRLRDYDGHVIYVPNGNITNVVNKSRLFAYAVIDIGVAYREDVDEGLAVMKEVADGMRKDDIFGPKILEDVEVVGVNEWADSAVMLRVRLKVGPAEQWGVRREYLRRLKHAFDERGIEIPFPHLTVYAGEAKDGSAPPFRLRTVAAAGEPAQPG
ncbi:MAG TPA: mechanosensitive ion channel family protein [Pelomicrobium sp.]|nr:mechanosensitive ion channel family protein [Pelomicrobium sp.]